MLHTELFFSCNVYSKYNTAFNTMQTCSKFNQGIPLNKGSKLCGNINHRDLYALKLCQKPKLVKFTDIITSQGSFIRTTADINYRTLCKQEVNPLRFIAWPCPITDNSTWPQWSPVGLARLRSLRLNFVGFLTAMCPYSLYT